ncbi:MAG: phosphatidate cytidylyltransferase [Anaerolineaceae bacterium]|nr:phosphatidate cytidylyltransferase [Anaerolineaceae bacterium]
MPLWLAFFTTFILSIIWLRLIDFFAVKGLISKKLSRKIIHIGTGPIFVLCWLLFPEELLSRYIAAIIPLLITIQFFLIGIGAIKDQASVDAMSRTGDPKEILKGPFFYGVVFVLLTIIFWRESPIGIVALMILCGGDGFADIIGRRVPSIALKWSPSKSIAGTISMLLGGLIFSSILILIYIEFGFLNITFLESFPKILLLNILATIVESLPVKDWDNVTVPVIVVLVGLILF